MKTPIFVSWSGERSREVALALVGWIKLVLQMSAPWHSDTIDAGRRWSTEIAMRLATAKVGIICVVPENLTAPWLLFETGALAKSLSDENRVIPYLFGLTTDDVKGPLSQFHAKTADRQGTLEMLRSINGVLDEPLTGEELDAQFDAHWPRLHEKLSAILRKQGQPKRQERGVAEMVGEVLEIVREIQKRPEPVSLADRVLLGVLPSTPSHKPDPGHSLAALHIGDLLDQEEDAAHKLQDLEQGLDRTEEGSSFVRAGASALLEQARARLALVREEIQRRPFEEVEHRRAQRLEQGG